MLFVPTLCRFPVRSRKRVSARLRPAFTLIELLTVVAIVAILATILIPVVSSVRKASTNAQCVSTMRSIGTGIQMYVADNETLPGPLYGHVIPQTRVNSSGPQGGHLFSFIAPYLSITTSSSNLPVPAEYLCVGWRQNVQGNWRTNNAPVYMVNGSANVPASNGRVFVQSPWGAANREGRLPFRYADIAELNDLHSTWALSDLDALNTSSAASLLPQQPVHGDHRNRLYFDWHVGRVTVTD